MRNEKITWRRRRARVRALRLLLARYGIGASLAGVALAVRRLLPQVASHAFSIATIEPGPTPRALTPRPDEPQERSIELLHTTRGLVLWEADPSGLQLTFVSETADTLLGYPARDWLAGRGFLREHVHPDDWSRLAEAMYQAAIEGGVQTCDHRMLKADGTALWVHTSVQPGPASSRALSICGVTMALSTTGSPHEDARQSEALRRLLLEGTRDHAIFLLSSEGTIQLWNIGAQRLLLYPVEEILGAPFAQLFPSEEVTSGVPGELIRQAQLTGSAEYDGRLGRKDGTTLWATMSLSAVREEQGSRASVVVLAKDISQRKQIEEGLHHSEQQFRLLVENVKDYALFMVSTQGTVESWNRGAQRMKGYRAHEIMGSPIARFFPPDLVARGELALLIERAAMSGSASYEGWLIRKGGEQFWGLVTLDAVEDERGHLVGFSNVARDLTERKLTEEALRKSEEHFRLLIDSVNDYAVFMMSPEGLVTTWNRGAQRVKGYRAHEIIGAHMAVFFLADELERGTPARLLETASIDGHSSYEGWLVRKGGVMFWASLNLDAIEDESGRLRGFSNVARDMTEYRRRDEALRDSEERLRLLLESVQDYGMFMISPAGHVEGWNPGAERLAGYQAREIVGSLLARFFPPEEIEQRTPDRLRERARAEGRAEYEGWLLRKSGARFWASLILNAVKDHQDSLRGFSIVARDLTDRMRAERAQALLSELGSVVAGAFVYPTTLTKVAQLAVRELSDWCAIHVGDDDRIQPVAIAHISANKEQLARTALRDLAKESRLSRGVAFVVGTGRSEVYHEVSEVAWMGEVLGIEPPDVLRELGLRSYMCVPLTARGKTLGAITLVSSGPGHRYGSSDLQLAEEFARRVALALDNARLYREAQEEAQEAVRARDEFISIASHDLKAPLQAMRLRVHMLLRNDDSGQAQLPEGMSAKLESINRQIDRMVEMFDALLDISRITAGRFEIQREQVDLSALVHDVAAQLSENAAAAGCELRIRADQPVVGSWDRLRLEQVVMNLVSNAIKYGKGKPIDVAVEQEKATATLLVRDHGVGIPPEQQDRVFDRFERVSQGRQVSGFGVGLWIVRRIVEAHGGRIQLDSQPGVGASFKVDLPITA